MNRLYPWGDDKPDNTRANYWDTDNSPHLQVGSKTQGKGPFGHLDLAGSMSEWVFDWWAARFYGTDGDPKACSNCANDVPDSEPEAATWRVNRGGNWLTYSTYLRAASRGEGVDGATFSPRTGIRCARDSK
jgi:formylglycine-generating enzyme required for sulfatase activity